MIPALATVAVVSFVLAFLGTFLARNLLIRFRVLDLPTQRSSHNEPTPRGGGAAIVVTFVIMACFAGAFHQREIAVITVSAACIALVGFADDVRHLSASIKLGAQVICIAALVLFGHLVLREIDPRLPTLPTALAIAATFFWVAGICNAYNFMDGINGLAAIEAVICGVTIGWLMARKGDLVGAEVAISLAAASAGFLPRNFPRASVFMGDVGSATIGYVFAALGVRYAQGGGSFLAAALPLMPFGFDTAATLTRRIMNRELFLMPHRSHFYQRLTALGWTHTSVSALWSVLAISCAVVALLLERWPAAWVVTAICALVGLHSAVAIAITLAERERIDEQRGQPTWPGAK